MTDTVVSFARFRYPSEDDIGRIAHALAIKALTEIDTFGSVEPTRLRYEFSAELTGGANATITCDFDLHGTHTGSTLVVSSRVGCRDDHRRSNMLADFASRTSGNAITTVIMTWYHVLQAAGAFRLVYATWHYDIPDPHEEGWIRYLP